GSVAPPEAINAEALSVTSNQQLVDAEATLQQRETQLKNLISRTGTADPLLVSTRIVPIDRITIPDREDLPPVEELVKLAIANRTDLLNQQASFETSEINALGTRNGLLPSLTAFAAAQNAGLAGTPRFVTQAPGQPPQGPDPFFIGNVDTALGQVFRRNFPTQRAGVFLSATLKNRQAQADYAIDQLQLRQNELSNRKNTSEVQVAVLNYIVQVQQARARHEATVRNRVLQQQLFEAEQKKFQLGASIPYNVITQQRDLVNAQAAELNALITYSNARTGLDQTTGRTLEANNVSLTEARDGRVSRVSTPSEAPVPQP
ncbi:MAG: TolC family protein, partial [Bryobacteraceae bacterium]|nr:TolC family protein [Bryobacteraceae bacterium]